MSKRRRPNVIMSLICTILAVGVVAVCVFPWLNLEEGTLVYAVLSSVHALFDGYVNFFAQEALRPYGLIPVALLCILNLILALTGSGLLPFIFRCTAFYSLYLLSTFFQDRAQVFAVLGVLPSYYHLLALAGLLVSVAMLVLLSAARRRSGSARKAPADEPKAMDAQDQGMEAPVNLETVHEEPEVQTRKVYDHDPAKSRKALSSLTATVVPKFESFPNYLGSSSVSSVDRGVYSVSEREAQIRRQEQERREAEARRLQEEERLKRIAEEEERARLEAEENRKRLQNMFKPRNLMKRFNEDAMAEKSFPTYGTAVPDVDLGITDNTPSKPLRQVPKPQTVTFQNQFETPAPRIVPGNDIPVSQMQNPFTLHKTPVAFSVVEKEETQREPEPVIEEPEVRGPSVFKEAAVQAEIDEQLAARRRSEERKVTDRQRHEVEQPPKPQVVEDEGLSDEELSNLAEMTKAETSENAGADIDMVSGVAGLKSSAGGNSYLLDRQKFVYKFPPESLLMHYPISATVYEDLENDPYGQIIVETLAQFRIGTSLIGVQHGPTFTLYELSLAPGIKVATVLNLSENIAMQLSVEDVRILAPIPGKVAIGVEVPNKKRDTIGFDVMMPALKSRFYKIPMVLGKTITGDSIVVDLAKTPHLLVAGTTGSGKSVCINSLICSVLYTKTPKEVRMILVDPKMVELSLYNGIPHLLTPVITDAKKALKAMNFVVDEMQRRMTLFASIGAKKIDEYNAKITEKGLLRVKLPYIMVIIDEFADLMLSVGKELETSIKRITAVARFCGIHLVLATQRPSADVITGIIKSNIPTQIAFAVSNAMNSRIIIDQTGAEKLLGRGDMLYNNPEARQPLRIQGAFIDSEIEDIVSFVKTQGEPDYIDESYFEDDDEEDESESESAQTDAAEDKLMRAWKIVSDRGEASGSFLQRKMGVGYNTAANLIEQLEEAGYIGPARGSKPREILRYYGSD